MSLSRHAPGWRTRFGSWIAHTSVPTIVDHLSADPNLRVTRHGVYQWVYGHAPTADRAQALVRLSAGSLSFEAIYSHRQELVEMNRCGSRSNSTPGN